MEEPRPPVWRLIQQAVESLGSPTTNVAVRDWILQKYPGTNTGTIQAQIAYCTVNHDSRVHGPENRRVRSVPDERYDFLYRPARGELERYDPARHGVWSIVEREDGRLAVACQDEMGEAPLESEVEAASGFVAEAHLRDYLAEHLDVIEPGLELFADEHGSVGVEYATPIGRIDILAIDRAGGLVVVELKVGRGADAVCGQLLRYKGWVSRHLANGRSVRGIIVARTISDRIRYALVGVDDVYAKEYELTVTLKDSPLA
jgi:endonuclease